MRRLASRRPALQRRSILGRHPQLRQWPPATCPTNDATTPQFQALDVTTLEGLDQITANAAVGLPGIVNLNSGNDVFATGYYHGDDLPFTSEFARSFTTFDHYHASLLGPTYPNRLYMHSAQSGGHKDNTIPGEGYTWPTIWNKLEQAGVPARYYYSDLPFLALFGPSTAPILHPAADFFTDCAAGTLPA